MAEHSIVSQLYENVEKVLLIVGKSMDAVHELNIPYAEKRTVYIALTRGMHAFDAVMDGLPALGNAIIAEKMAAIGLPKK